ncbi:hypothetical protein BOO24_19510 [Vibrio navarrensis]|nr:hypothetical protein [Vibrio navarrensis]
MDVSIISDWLNANQGVLTLAIFLLTLILGWISGIFSALRQRPKFKITFLKGPTFVCTYPTGEESNGYDVHRTGISLYLKVANVGNAPSSIENVSVAYHWALKPFSKLWFKNSIGWFWLKYPTVAINDFQVNIGENVKFYPFLLQRSHVSGNQAETFLVPGRSSNGVVYFEQGNSFGGCYPKGSKGIVRIKIAVEDVHGKKHVKKLKVPSVTFDEAVKYNPSFGRTLVELHDSKVGTENNTADVT